jgi:hypothetical protein
LNQASSHWLWQIEDGQMQLSRAMSQLCPQ